MMRNRLIGLGATFVGVMVAAACTGASNSAEICDVPLFAEANSVVSFNDFKAWEANRKLAECPEVPPSQAEQLEGERAKKRVRLMRTTGKPSEQVLDLIEQQVVADPCVGSLDKWDRNYSFGLDMKNVRLDEGVVNFVYREAGKYGFVSQRRSVPVGALLPGVDDRDYRIAFGRFEVGSRRTVVESCGNNVGPG